MPSDTEVPVSATGVPVPIIKNNGEPNSLSSGKSFTSAKGKSSIQENDTVPDGAFIPDHTNRDHAILAPSSAAMNMLCLASLVPIPPEHRIKKVATFSSDQGTTFHAYMDKLQVTENPITRLAIIKSVSAEDPKMARYLQKGFNITQKIKEAIDPRLIVNELIEQKVKFSEHIYGTNDWGLMYIKEKQKRAFVLDYKYGVNPVYLEYPEIGLNPQLMIYLVALMNTHNWRAEEATIAIYQPRSLTVEENGSGFIQRKVTGAEIKDFTKKLKAFEKKALKIISGETPATKVKEVVGDHCKYCPRVGICKTFREAANVKGIIALQNAKPLIGVSPGLDAGTRLTPKKAGEEFHNTTMKTLITEESYTDEQINLLLDNEPIIQNFYKHLKKYVTGRILAGNPVKGRKLVNGKSIRKLKKNQDLLADSLEPLGINPFITGLKTITQLEEELGKRLPDELVEYTNPPLILAKDTDKRESITELQIKKLTAIPLKPRDELDEDDEEVF